MADHLKYDNATGHLVYGANGHLVHTCEGCCLLTATIGSCPDLAGSYDLDANMEFADGTVTITFAGSFSVSLDADPMGTFATFNADGSYTCAEDTTWSADDWDGCGAGTPTMTLACTA